MSQPRILVLYMGGTIGMHGDPLVPGPLSALQANIPQLQDLPYNLEYEEFFLGEIPIDSSNANYELFNKLAQRIGEAHADYDGIVVVGGTDTMAPTAAAISYLVEGIRKPVIFTGSMKPAGTPESDGPRNLLNAIHTAATGECTEVAVSMWKRLIRATQAFKYDNSNVDAFRTAEGEDLGTYSEDDTLTIDTDRLLKSTNQGVIVRALVERSIVPVDLYQPMPEQVFEGYLNALAQNEGVPVLYGAKITPGSERQQIIQRVFGSDRPMLYTQGEPMTTSSIKLHGSLDPQQLLIKAGYIASIAPDRPTLKVLAASNLRGEGVGPLQRESDILNEAKIVPEGQEGHPSSTKG